MKEDNVTPTMLIYKLGFNPTTSLDSQATMSLTLLLRCNDLEETKAFYAEILDFEVADGPEQTCTVKKAGASIIFTAENFVGGVPCCTGTI